MKITAAISKNSARATKIDINAGEPLSVPLVDSAGAAWAPAMTVVAYLNSSRTALTPCPFSVTGSALSLSAVSSAALTPGRYRVQLWVSSATPSTDGSADLVVEVH